MVASNILVKGKILDYIRAQVDLNDMAAHIRKMMNVETLQVYSKFLNSIEEAYTTYADYVSSFFIIKHDLLFLVYKEVISIYEAQIILEHFLDDLQQAVKNAAGSEEDADLDGVYKLKIQKLLDDLFIFVILELALESSNAQYRWKTECSIFDYLSKIYLGDSQHFGYATQSDLNTDLAKIRKLPLIINEEATTYESYLSNFSYEPYILNESPTECFKIIGELAYAETLRQDHKRIVEKPSQESINIYYTDDGMHTKDAMENWSIDQSCMKNATGTGYYGKYNLLSYPNEDNDNRLSDRISKLHYFLILCQNVRNRMISYAINS